MLFEKKFGRDDCETLGWDKKYSGPMLHDDVDAGKRAFFFFFNDRATPEISPLSLPDPFPILPKGACAGQGEFVVPVAFDMFGTLADTATSARSGRPGPRRQAPAHGRGGTGSLSTCSGSPRSEEPTPELPSQSKTGIRLLP